MESETITSTAELYMLDGSGNRDDDPWHVTDKLFQALKSHLEPDTKVTQQDVLHCVKIYHPSQRDPQTEPEDQTVESEATWSYNIWDPFHMIARQLPHDDPRQDRLVACLKLIIQNYGHPWTLDKQLDLDSNHISSERDIMWWRNFNSYAARITREEIKGVDFISWGILAMRRLWINEVRIQLRHAHAKSKDTVSVHVRNKDVDMDVPVGLDWIRIAGAQLCRLGRGKEADDTPLKSVWEEWKENVRDIIGDEGVSEETKMKAKEIERTMGELERQGKGDESDSQVLTHGYKIGMMWRD